MLNWVISLISFCLMLGGSLPDTVRPCRVVTEITVEWQEENTPQSRRYTDQGKMNKVLNCLRSLDPIPLAPGSAPEAAPSVQYEIRLLRSDGSAVRFTQQGLTNFRKDGGQWMRIDPEDAIRLPLVLAAIPGDNR